jgi:putative hemolysin
MKKKPVDHLVAAEKTVDAEGTPLTIPVNRKLGSCLTRRADIIWIDTASKKAGILEAVLARPDFEYFPICAKTVDNVLGVLSARTFLASLQEREWPGLKALAKKPVYLPETVSIVRALETMAASDSRMAFIIDEYGGIEGLVTRNGLISELLSDLTGDGAADEGDLFERGDGSWLVGGQIRVDEIAELFDISIDEESKGDYYTLAGYLLSINGSIPKTGDILRSGGWKYEIVDMDGHRIDKVLVSRADETAGSSTGSNEANLPEEPGE